MGIKQYLVGIKDADKDGGTLQQYLSLAKTFPTDGTAQLTR